jgi:hypothetical protein
LAQLAVVGGQRVIGLSGGGERGGEVMLVVRDDATPATSVALGATALWLSSQ